MLARDVVPVHLQKVECVIQTKPMFGSSSRGDVSNHLTLRIFSVKGARDSRKSKSRLNAEIGDNEPDEQEKEFTLHDVRNVDALSSILADKFSVTRDRFAFCIKGTLYENDADHTFATIGEDLKRPEVFVVVLIRFRIWIQVLAHPKTRFQIWLPTGEEIMRDALCSKFFGLLQRLSRSLFWITSPGVIVGSAFAEPDKDEAEEGEDDTDCDEYKEEDEDEEQEEDQTEDGTDQHLKQRRMNISSDYLRDTMVRKRRRIKGSRSCSRQSHEKRRKNTLQTHLSRKIPLSDAGDAASPPSNSTVRRIAIRDLYVPVHNDTLVIVPRFQWLWRLCYCILRVVWLLMAFVCSTRPTFRANPTLAPETEQASDGRERLRNRYRLDQDGWSAGGNYRHHRYAPGENPHGEDLTLILRQGLFGL
ncbi:unnamed protein product [Amoebophrya sp. A25]|nr:unnamed protein product [Amoebophrya sp. A25]|eukprot:GSA25T00013462001.1